MRKTRFSVMAFVTGTVILACAAACVDRSYPEGANLVPADATFAVSFDIQEILDSRLYKRFESRDDIFGRNRLNFYRFAEAAGLDPARDIDRVLFLARASEGGLEDMSALVTGAFDGEKVHQYLVDSGLPSTESSGIDIFEFIVVNDRCVFCIAVIDSSTAAFGDGETLVEIAQVREGSLPGITTGEKPARLLSRMTRNPDVWGIVRAEDLRGALRDVLARMSNETGALSALGPVQAMAFSFNATEPMRVLVEVAASSEEDAMLVADVLTGAEALGRLALRETRPELARLMSDLVIEADTGVVRVAGSIPTSDVETVTRLLGASWIAETVNRQGIPEGESSPSDDESAR